MKAFLKIQLYIIAAILLNCNLFAENIFDISPAPQLKVNFKEQLFIDGDFFCQPGENFSQGNMKYPKVENWEKVLQVLGRNPRLQYVKEAGIRNGKIELNIWAATSQFAGNPFYYKFKVPVSFLKSAKYKVVTGRFFGSAKTSKFTGVEKENMPLFSGNLRFLEIDRGANSITMDFNPEGVWNLDTGSISGNCETNWTVKRQGENYIFSAKKIGRNNLGHIFQVKVIIYAGQRSYSSIHPVSNKYYIHPIPKALCVNFGYNKFTGYSVCQNQLYSENKKYGWIAGKIRISKTKTNDPLKKCYATSSQPGTFKIKTHPGRYILVIQYGNAEKSSGPFEVSVNSHSAVIMPVRAKGVFGSVALRAVTDNKGCLLIKFTGKNWEVNSLLLQSYLFADEDYLFNRNWWLVPENLPALALVKRGNKQ